MIDSLCGWALLLFTWTTFGVGEAWAIARLFRPRSDDKGSVSPVLPLWIPEPVVAVSIQTTLLLAALLTLRLPVWITGISLGAFAGWRGRHWPSVPPAR